MIYRVLADLVLVAHLGFILFVITGGLLALRWRRAMWLHLPAAVWGGFIEVSGRICPLTPLENWLRRAGDAPGYSGGFIEHYLVPVIYPPGLSAGAQIVLAGLLLAANAVIYGFVWRHWRGRGTGKVV